MNSRRLSLVLVAALGVSLAIASEAQAQDPDCTSLPDPIIGQGGSAQKAFVGLIATRLAARTSPTTLIYSAPGACVGTQSLLNESDTTPVTGTGAYWDGAGVEHRCQFPVTGAAIDFALMGNTIALCPDVDTLPASVGDFRGPIGTVNVLVPFASNQQSISTEALYFIYGFGASGQAAPWTDESQIIRRDENSFVQQFIALASGVPASRFIGVDARSNPNTITLLNAAPDPNAAIGFASGEFADLNREVVRTLAYQHVDQTCGYWPDSAPNLFDKINVRNGQYFLWADSHYFARVDGTGAIVDPQVGELIGWITGAVPAPADIPILDLTIDNGNVPQCAMHVTRTTDLGPLASYQPAEPCGCYFDFVATGATTCTPCPGGNGDCPSSSPVCRHNYCEVQ